MIKRMRSVVEVLVLLDEAYSFDNLQTFLLNCTKAQTQPESKFWQLTKTRPCTLTYRPISDGQ